jgi:hypothetical protein
LATNQHRFDRSHAERFQLRAARIGETEGVDPIDNLLDRVDALDEFGLPFISLSAGRVEVPDDLAQSGDGFAFLCGALNPVRGGQGRAAPP